MNDAATTGPSLHPSAVRKHNRVAESGRTGVAGARAVRVDDDGVFGESRFVQEVQQAADIVIDGGDGL